MHISECCMKWNYFQFNGSFYEKVDGVAMGNCVSPFLPNLFMSKFEEKLRNNLQYFPRVWLRYVDDIFDTGVAELEGFLSQINGVHNNIKFDYEREDNNCLAFLDLLCIRKGNGIQFDIYRKLLTITDIFLVFQIIISSIKWLLLIG
uniref:Reverse transcriptase domain-containing protein n=1 Tax=Clastoptera arizonana TaxID=38151 RepID=A0A1B6E8I7_9HEMI